MHRFMMVMPVLLVSWFIAGCGKSDFTIRKDPQKPVVVATTTHLADLIRQIGGEHLSVIQMMKAGVDPHSYRATAQDITHLQSADLIVYHGLSLEGKMARVFKDTTLSRRPPFSPCANLANDQLLSGEDKDQVTDPHIWFSPDLWIQCGQSLTTELSGLLPEKSTEFNANFLKFRKSVEKMDRWGKSVIQSIPPASRILITSHDAFRYFGDHFGIRVIALQGINTLTEAGLADRTNLVEFIDLHNSPALFIESSVNPKALKEIARETGSIIGGTLFSDALGSEDQSALGPNEEVLSTATWQGMMAHNLRTIQKALHQVP